MCYLNQPRNRISVISYEFFSPAKNIGKNIGKNTSKNLSGKYSQKPLDHAKKSTTDVLLTTSKIVIQKTAEEPRDLIDNKIGDKITKVAKLCNRIIQEQLQVNLMIKKHIKKDLYLQKKDTKLMMI